MSRTFRRIGERHEYRWVLLETVGRNLSGWSVRIDPQSKAGRRALALFHSDNVVTMGGCAPRWFRKVSDHQIRTANDRMFRRWRANPDFDPVFQSWHRHEANWSWW